MAAPYYHDEAAGITIYHGRTYMHWYVVECEHER